MSDNQNLNCEQSRDQLDILIETMVEARIKAEASPSASRLAPKQHSFEPQGALREHLSTCSDCHNYQLANRVIIEAARALPKLEGDEALTQSILAMIEADQMQEIGAASPAAATATPAAAALASPTSATAALASPTPAAASLAAAVPVSANPATAAPAAAAPATTAAERPFLLSAQNPFVLAVTALAFILLVSTSAGFTVEACWSAVSWGLALGMVAMLKPFIEAKAGLQSQTAGAAKA